MFSQDDHDSEFLELQAIKQWLKRYVGLNGFDKGRCAWKARLALHNRTRADDETERWLTKLADRGRLTEKRYARRILKELQRY